MKLVIQFIVVVAFVAVCSLAWAGDSDLVKTANSVLGKGAPSENVEVSNSKITNKVKIDKGISVGNSGVDVSGKNINIQNSKIENDVEIKKGASIGNSGIQIGD